MSKAECERERAIGVSSSAFLHQVVRDQMYFRHPGRGMSITISHVGDTVILGVGEQLIVGNRHELKQAFLDELEAGKRKFRIDFQRTTGLDSSGLGVLVSLSKRLREKGGELRLEHLNDDLRTLFSLTKLDTLFQIDD